MLIGDSVDKVQAGTRLAAEAGDTMREVVASVQRVAGTIGEVTGTTAQQAEGIIQINETMSQMDAVVQQNSALVEQAAAAADALQQQAQELAEAVGVFRLEKREPAALATHPAASRTPAPKRLAAAAGAGDWEEF